MGRNKKKRGSRGKKRSGNHAKTRSSQTKECQDVGNDKDKKEKTANTEKTLEEEEKLSERGNENLTGKISSKDDAPEKGFELLKKLNATSRDLNFIFEDLTIDESSRLPIFGHKNKNPAVVVRVNESKINIFLTGNDRELLSLIKALSYTRRKHIIRCNSIKRSEKDAEFEGLEIGKNRRYKNLVVDDTASSIYTFYKLNMVTEGHTYWVVKDDDVVRLYNLSKISETTKDDSFKPRGAEGGRSLLKLPCRSHVALLYFRVAKGLWNTDLRRQNYKRILYFVKCCIGLLDIYKYPKVYAQCLFLMCGTHYPLVQAVTPDTPQFLEEDTVEERSKVKKKGTELDLESCRRILTDECHLEKYEKMNFGLDISASIKYANECINFLLLKFRNISSPLLVENRENCSICSNEMKVTYSKTETKGPYEDVHCKDRYYYLLKDTVDEAASAEYEETPIEIISCKKVMTSEEVLNALIEDPFTMNRSENWGKNLIQATCQRNKPKRERYLITKRNKKKKSSLALIKVTYEIDSSIYEETEVSDFVMPWSMITIRDWEAFGWEGRLIYKIFSKMSFLFVSKAKEALLENSIKFCLRCIEVSKMFWRAMLRVVNTDYPFPNEINFITGEMYFFSADVEVYRNFQCHLSSPQLREIEAAYESLRSFLPSEIKSCKLEIPKEAREGIILAYNYYSLGFESEDGRGITNVQKMKYAFILVNLSYFIISGYEEMWRRCKRKESSQTNRERSFRVARVMLRRAINLIEEVSDPVCTISDYHKFRFHFTRGRLFSYYFSSIRNGDFEHELTERESLILRSALTDYLCGYELLRRNKYSKNSIDVGQFICDLAKSICIYTFICYYNDVELQVWEIAILMRKAYSLVGLLDDKIYSSYLTTVYYYMNCVIASTYHDHLKRTGYMLSLERADLNYRRELEVMLGMNPGRRLILKSYMGVINFLGDARGSYKEETEIYWFISVLRCIIACSFSLRFEEEDTEEDSLKSGIGTMPLLVFPSYEEVLTQQESGDFLLKDNPGASAVKAITKGEREKYVEEFLNTPAVNKQHFCPQLLTLAGIHTNCNRIPLTLNRLKKFNAVFEEVVISESSGSSCEGLKEIEAGSQSDNSQNSNTEKSELSKLPENCKKNVGESELQPRDSSTPPENCKKSISESKEGESELQPRDSSTQPEDCKKSDNISNERESNLQSQESSAQPLAQSSNQDEKLLNIADNRKIGVSGTEEEGNRKYGLPKNIKKIRNDPRSFKDELSIFYLIMCELVDKLITYVYKHKRDCKELIDVVEELYGHLKNNSKITLKQFFIKVIPEMNITCQKFSSDSIQKLINVPE